MRRLLAILSLFVLLVGGAAAQDGIPLPQEPAAPTPTPLPVIEGGSIALGDTLEIETQAETLSNVTFTLEAPQIVTIIARGTAEGANPAFTLLNGEGRELVFIDNTESPRVDIAPRDASLDSVFLLPDTYTIQVIDIAGASTVALTVEESDPGALGAGEIEISEGEVTAIDRGGEVPDTDRVLIPLEFVAGEVVTIRALGQTPITDLVIALRTAGDTDIARNDDDETGDILLNVGDAKLENVIIPATGTYTLLVRGFNGESVGPYQLVITRYGVAQPSPESTTTFTGELLPGQRTSFDLELAAGEFLDLWARGVDPVDTELTLYDPEGVLIGRNDDLDPNNPNNPPGLTELDSYLPNIVTGKAGTYTVEVRSVAGKGTVEVAANRRGVVQPGDFTPAPVPSPESTAEVQPES